MNNSAYSEDGTVSQNKDGFYRFIARCKSYGRITQEEELSLTREMHELAIRIRGVLSSDDVVNTLKQELRDDEERDTFERIISGVRNNDHSNIYKCYIEAKFIDELCFRVIAELETHCDDDVNHSCKRCYEAISDFEQLHKILDRIVKCNVFIVLKFARDFYNSSLSIGLDDVFQLGLIGLIEGVLRFDYNKGIRLSTYVYWWIRNALTRNIDVENRLIRLPEDVRQRYYKFKRIYTGLFRELGQKPSKKLLQERLGWSDATYKRISGVLEEDRFLNINETIGSTSESEGMSIQEVLSDDALAIDEALMHKEKVTSIRKALAILEEENPRSAYILMCRFGIDYDRKTLQELADDLNLSRERVRQIERKSLLDLRQIMSRVIHSPFKGDTKDMIL